MSLCKWKSTEPFHASMFVGGMLNLKVEFSLLLGKGDPVLTFMEVYKGLFLDRVDPCMVRDSFKDFLFSLSKEEMSRHVKRYCHFCERYSDVKDVDTCGSCGKLLLKLNEVENNDK